MPVVVALNMIDVAEGQGLKIDVERLSQQLGVPVVPIQANKGKGLDQLKAAIASASQKPGCLNGPTFPEAFESEVTRSADVCWFEVPVFLVRRLLLDVGGHTEQRLTEKHGPTLANELQAARQRLAQAGFRLPAVEARMRYGWIRKATAGCVQRPPSGPSPGPTASTAC